MSFNLFSRSCLGIDIGSSSVKVVELSRFGKKVRLKNYAQFQTTALAGAALKMFNPETFLLLDEKVSTILKTIFNKAKIKERRVGVSLPDFSTFFTVFQLPPMPEHEIARAVEFEAHRHIPLPLSEVSFDWEIIERKELSSTTFQPKILLVAVPNKVIQQYQRMVTLSELNLQGLEAEVFSLIRGALSSQDKKKVVCLVDLGWQSSTLNIADKGFLKQSFTFDLSGRNLAKKLSEVLQVDMLEAEKMKKRFGLSSGNKEVAAALKPEIDAFSQKIQTVLESFFQKEGKKVEKIILAGNVDFPYLREYLAKLLKKPVEIADPFSNIACPSLLKERLQQLGPSLCIAMGVALRGLET